MHSVLCKSHLSSDEEHSARRQPFIVCHQYHLGNDLFRAVAMAMVICMEMMLVLVEDEEAADIGEGGDKARGMEEVWPRWKEDTCVVALPSIMCHHKGCQV